MKWALQDNACDHLDLTESIENTALEKLPIAPSTDS